MEDEILRKALPSPDAVNLKLFVCGPPGFMEHVVGNKGNPFWGPSIGGLLGGLGYSKAQVYRY